MVYGESCALVVQSCLVLRTGPWRCDSGRLSVKTNWTQKLISVKLTAWEWLEETVGTLMAGQLFNCHTYLVFGPVLVGLQKAQSLLCQTNRFQPVMSHSVKIGLWTYPWFRGSPYIPVHLFSCIARLRLVHSVDILHTKVLSVSRRVSVK